LSYGEDNDPALREALAIFRQLADRFPDEPRHRVNLATTYLWIRGEQHCRHAIATLERVLAQLQNQDRTPSHERDHYHGGVDRDWDCGCFGHYQLLLADGLLGLGTHLLVKGELAEAEQQLRRAETLLEVVAGQYPDVAWHHWGLANTRFNLGRVLQAAGRC